MTESASSNDINITGLLLQISQDVASIKTDMTNFKESQKVEKENTLKEIQDVRDDFGKSLDSLKTRIDSMQTAQNTLVAEVDTLKHSQDVNDAKKWRKVTAYILTAIGGVLVAKLPDFFNYLIMWSKVK